MKASRLLLLFGLGFMAAVFVVGVYIVPRAQSGNAQTPQQSDANRVPVGDIYVDVTYATPQFIKRVHLQPYLKRFQGRAQPFLVGINTHVGSIEHLDLTGKVELEDNHGDRYPALGSPVVLSEHHNMYLMAFPLLDNHGKPIFAASRGFFRLIIHHVGRTPKRVFTWKLPVQEPARVRTLANTLMMALGVVGALMVILSPCAIELTTYYTGIITGVVGSTALEYRGHPDAKVWRGRILKNLAGFVAGFTTLYMASGATVGWLGQSLIQMQSRMSATAAASVPAGSTPKRPTAAGGASSSAPDAHSPLTPLQSPSRMSHPSILGKWARPANWLGAAFLIYFALRSIGWIRSGQTCFVKLGRLGRRLRLAIAWVVGWLSPKHAAIIRSPCQSVRCGAPITPLNCFCAGLGLSVSCLTCMGGAILYPLLIFVGTSTWYWGAMILGTYSLALAIPMAAIAVAIGDFTWKYAQHRWISRGLQWTSAVVMIFVAVLILFDRTRFVNSVVFGLLNALGGNPGPAMAKL